MGAARQEYVRARGAYLRARDKPERPGGTWSEAPANSRSAVNRIVRRLDELDLKGKNDELVKELVARQCKTETDLIGLCADADAVMAGDDPEPLEPAMMKSQDTILICHRILAQRNPREYHNKPGRYASVR
mgnify:CR=1 FL=1